MQSAAESGEMGWRLQAVSFLMFSGQAPDVEPEPPVVPTLNIPEGSTVEEAGSGRVTLTGRVPAGAVVEVEVRSEVQVGRVVADAEGLWSWTPPNSLAPGEHRYRARIIDGEVVGEWSEYRTFMVFGETSEAGGDELTDKLGGGSEIPRTGASSAWALAAGLGLMSLGLGGLVMQRRFRDVAGEL